MKVLSSVEFRLSHCWTGASIPIPWWRRCATSEIGGERFFGSLGGRTKNIDVLMIVMLKLANGFSDYEQVPVGVRIVAYCPRRLLQLR